MTNQFKENKLAPIAKDDITMPELASSYVQKIYKIPLLTASDEIELAKKVEQGDMTARTKFIESNLRLVNSIAWKYFSKTLEQMDLIQEGNLGLIRAVDTFDYKRGIRFATYAIFLIRQTIIQALKEKSRLIRVTQQMQKTIYEIIKTKEHLRQLLGHEPSIEEISQRLEISIKKVRLVLATIRDPISLDDPYTRNFDSLSPTIRESLIDELAKTPDEEILDRDLVMEINEFLNKLPDRSKDIIQLRFGLAGRGEYTLKEIGKMMNASQERVKKNLERLFNRFKKETFVRNRD